MSRVASYHTDLDVWQVAKRLALEAYSATSGFPTIERFALADQVRRAAASVPGNIAEGCGRGTPAELVRFLRVARGSLSELHSHLSLADDLGYLRENREDMFDLVARVHRMLNALIGSVTRSKS